MLVALSGLWMTVFYPRPAGDGEVGPIGAADELPRTVLMTAGWLINVALAEYVIRRPTRARLSPA